ncbi:MAG: hypothetical protein AAB092_07585 [Chloroflexota bacterium]
MSTRILIVPAVVALALLAACGGGSKSSSPTPSEFPSPTPTPEPVACAADDLHAALIASESGAGGSQLLSIGMTNVLDGACFLDGPPAVNWYTEAGTQMAIPAATVVLCQPQAGDFTTCVYDEQVTLPAGAPTPAAEVNGQAIAFVAVNVSDVLVECDSPTEIAHSIGLAFTGLATDVQVELGEGVALPPCMTQVTLQGYGPLATPQE